jgi:hypothetical protein
MKDGENWDWQEGKKVLADLARIRSSYSRVDELAVSPDGEKIASPVKTKDDDFTVCVNGEPWEDRFELCWYVRFSPAGKLVALVKIDDEWTLAVDGVPGQERFEYAWNPIFSADGRGFAFAYKRDNLYGVSVGGKTWERGFTAIRNMCVSPDGSKAAATVQVKPLGEADVAGFFEGVWSVAVDGVVWDKTYVNTWNPAFSSDGKSVAVEIRTDICDYSIAVNGRSWPSTYGGVWAPIFHPRNGSVFAPVRHEGGWTLFKDGDPIWKGRYNQLWHQRFSLDGKRIAAVVSPVFGRWTVAIDDKPWRRTLSDMVLAPVFSPDGGSVAAIVKEKNRWTIAVDGVLGEEDFDMIWDPVFSPDGVHVLAKAELGGKYFVFADGRKRGGGYDMLWDPAFSPDGVHVLLRYVEADKYCRQVVPVGDFVRGA